MLSRLMINSSITALLLLVLSAGCTTIYNPATERKETLFIDTASEVALGKDMDKQIRAELKILDDPKMQARLEAIGKNIASVSDRQDLKYTFAIVKDKEFNAFAIPGGFVYVNSGLINAASDEELASVLGHEIGHIAARHSVKRLQAVLGYQILMNIAFSATKQTTVLQAVDISFSLVSLGYSRQDEFLADKLAVRYARRANMNPYGMVTFFRKLKKENEKNGPRAQLVFLSSHPPIEERIKKAEEQIALTSINP